jgi:hypothetical protein
MVKVLLNPTDRKKERKLLMILTVHSMYNRKIVPTVSKIKKEIEDTIKISKSTLTLTLLDLGYKYKKIRR